MSVAAQLRRLANKPHARPEMKSIKTLNIAHVVFSFDYGGLERRILRLIESLSAYRCRFFVISLRHSDGRFLDSRFPVTHINVNAEPGVDFGAIKRVAGHLREHDVHIVHSHNWVSMLEGTLAGRLAKTPVCVHGEHGAKRFEPGELVWRRTMTQRVLCRFSDHIIPVNDAINARLRELWWLPGNRLTTIRNGVDTVKFHPAKDDTRDDSTTIHIGSVSRLDPVKNFPCLMRAVALLNDRSDKTKYRLTIVGGGDQLSTLEALRDQLDANDFIDFPGPTDAAETWYPQFDIYVNSSFSEGMSNTVLEAMACGLPIVATDVAGHRDWLREGEHALFFRNDDYENLAEKLACFGEDVNRRRAVCSTNRRYIENEFSQAQFIQRYQAIYKNLLAKKGLAFDFSPTGVV